MKRNVILKYVLVAVAAGIAIYFAACKKNIVTPIINNSVPTSIEDPNYTAEAKRIVNKINRFRTQLDNKEYLTKGDSYVPIDSAIWNVEALFNATYTFPERKYEKTVKQDVELFVEANVNDEVLMSAEANLYEEIITKVRQAYANDGISFDKSLMAVDIEKGENIGGNVSIIAHVISGRVDNTNTVKDPVDGPFGPGDCWYFGEYGGTCDDPSVFGDAAEVIEDSINYYYGGTGVPYSGYRVLNHSISKIYLVGNEYVDANGDYYAYFYRLDDNTPYYLDYDLLNYYYNRELALILNVVPTDLGCQGLLPSCPTFLEVDITGLMGIVGSQNCAYHRNVITYCSRVLIPSPVMPVPVDLL